MGVMEVLHDLREFCSFVGTGGHVAGYPDEVRRAAHHWKRRGDAIDALLHDLETSLAAGVQAGPGGNWNDDGQRAFRSFFDDVRAGLREQATHSHEMAKTLDDAAGQMDSFNSALEAIVIEIGIWIAATALVSWIPGVDVAEEGVAVARGTSLLARGVSILRRVALFLREIALVFGRAPRAARAAAT